MDISSCLTREQRDALKNIKQACRNENIKCYLVGGAVRDAVLNIPPRDIDICVDTDPMEILSLLEMEDYLYHPAFQTAAVKFKNGVEFDVIRCRTEIYEVPGALPEVSPSGIYEDLKRRDFTVNAIAYDLLENKILDPFQGLNHIEKGIIKSVHPNSYKEDPTRIFRAVKYAVRYNFSIWEIDEIKECIKRNVMDSISNDRYYKEIISICRENKWEVMLDICSSLGMFEIEEYNSNNILADYSDAEIRFLNFAYRLKNENILNKILDNSSIKKEIKKAVWGFKYGNIGHLLYYSMDNYEIYELLKKSSKFDRIMLCFDYKMIYKVLNYMEHSTYKPELDGNHIKTAANIQGKALGRLMEYLSRIRLNTGIMDEKKYFDENLGEILNAIEYKA